MSDIYCEAFVEDQLSKAVLEKLVEYRNAACQTPLKFMPGCPRNMHGCSKIQRRVPAMKNMVENANIPVVVLTDLDRRECAPTLIRDWFELPTDRDIRLPSRLVFRVAVVETESWLLADLTALASFLKIAKANFTSSPDALEDPKQYLLNIIRSKGRKSWHKHMLPQVPSDSIGPTYNEKLCVFVRDHWKPKRASKHSPSLEKTIQALSNLS